jgi:hypothetical protein
LLDLDLTTPLREPAADITIWLRPMIVILLCLIVAGCCEYGPARFQSSLDVLLGNLTSKVRVVQSERLDDLAVLLMRGIAPPRDHQRDVSKTLEYTSNLVEHGLQATVATGPCDARVELAVKLCQASVISLISGLLHGVVQVLKAS